MTELVAVACVVESSLILASEWSRVLVDYISPLLKRLGEAHTVGSQLTFRMAFVTYGTADTRPTPLLARRFFVPFQSVTKELREQPSNLGIGQTSSGGSRGMAALEGLVAAVELFDILRSCTETRPLQNQSLNQPRDTQQQTPRLVCHILHVAASPADNAQKPLWNNSPTLDDVSWETLPAELKKRNINLSIISIRPNARFAELHSSAATKGVTPAWFKVRSPHTLLLTGFPAEPKPTKRPPENQTSPETKRARVSQTPSEPSPNVTSSSPSSIPSTQTAPTIPPPQPINTSNLPNQPIPTGVPRSQQQAFVAKLREMEVEIHKLNQEHTAAIAQSRMEAAAQIKKERDAKVTMLERLKQAMAAAVIRNQQQQLQHARSNSQGQLQSTKPPAQSNTQGPMLPPQMPATTSGINSQEIPRGPDAQALIQLMQSRTGNNQNTPPAAQGIPIPPNVTSEMVSQMHKLVENRGIRPPQPPSFPQAQPMQQNLPQPIAIPAPAQQQTKHRGTTSWEGSLNWTGFDVTTHDRKEMHAQVKVASPTGDIMPATWPPNLTLTPSREPAVSVQDLQIWAKRTKALLCTFQPHARSIDQQTNERNFRSLVELLAQKHIYALAAWTLPSGTHATNLLIFPFNGDGLVGTAFPTAGIPEMPKPIMQQFPPSITAQLQRLTPDQRNLFLAQVVRHRQQQQPQPPQQQQFKPSQQPQQPPNYNLGPPNFGDSGRFDLANFQGNFAANGMNLLGNPPPASGGAMVSMMGSQPGGMGGLDRRTPSGSAMPQPGGMGLSYEMLQSFMQRNADGSGGAGMGPN